MKKREKLPPTLSDLLALCSAFDEGGSDVFDASDRFNLQPSTFVFQLTLTLPVTYGNQKSFAYILT